MYSASLGVDSGTISILLMMGSSSWFSFLFSSFVGFLVSPAYKIMGIMQADTSFQNVSMWMFLKWGSPAITSIAWYAASTFPSICFSWSFRVSFSLTISPRYLYFSVGSTCICPRVIFGCSLVLPMVRDWLFSFPNLMWYFSHALLDTGSTNTLMSELLANKLRIPGQDINYNFNTLSDRGVSSSKVVSVQLAPVGGGDPVNIDNAFVVSGNLIQYPVLNVDLQKFPHLSDFPLCSLDQSDVADLVIGMDNGHLLMLLDIQRSPKLVNELYAIRSYFGWSLHGYNGGSSSDMYSNFVALDRQVENLWNLECRDDFEMGMSFDDWRVSSLWNNEISFDDGHYTLPIPWREGRPNLPHSMYIAKCRLDSLRRKLTQTSITSKYLEQIEQMVGKGYAKPVPDDEIKLNVFTGKNPASRSSLAPFFVVFERSTHTLPNDKPFTWWCVVCK